MKILKRLSTSLFTLTFLLSLVSGSVGATGAVQSRPDRVGKLIHLTGVGPGQFDDYSQIYGFPADLISFSIQGNHLFTVRQNGEVWASGDDASAGIYGPGTLSLGTVNPAIKIGGIDNVKAVSFLPNAVFALKNDGTVWSWGTGRTILGRNLGPNADFVNEIDETPAPIPGLSNITQIASSGGQTLSHVLALKSDGTVWAWGTNNYGAVGNDPSVTFSHMGSAVDTPVQLTLPNPATSIAAGTTFSAAVLSDGSTAQWGVIWVVPEDSQKFTLYPTPQIVAGLQNSSQVSAEGQDIAVVKTDGTAWAWGDDQDDRLSIGTAGLPLTNGVPFATSPQQIQNIPLISVINLDFSGALVRATDGNLWGWVQGITPFDIGYPESGAFSLSAGALLIEPPADTTPPVVTGTPDRAPNSSGWYNAPVTITWSSVDPEPSSGTPTVPAPTTANLEGTHTYTSGQSCDPAGNCATGALTLSIDTVAPGASFSGSATVLRLFGGTIQGSATDSTSGVAQVTLTTTITSLSSAPNGGITLACNSDRTSCSWSVNPSSALPLGHYTVTVQVTDRAGNVRTITRQYTVV